MFVAPNAAVINCLMGAAYCLNCNMQLWSQTHLGPRTAHLHFCCCESAEWCYMSCVVHNHFERNLLNIYETWRHCLKKKLPDDRSDIQGQPQTPIDANLSPCWFHIPTPNRQLLTTRVTTRRLECMSIVRVCTGCGDTSTKTSPLNHHCTCIF